jgi:thiosulfate/3-mercaptopyruvate sulfurtransferase
MAAGGLLAACGASTGSVSSSGAGGFTGAGATQPPAGAAPDLVTSVVSLRQALAGGGIRILDARPTADYEKGHIPGAVSIPVTETFDPARDRNYPDVPERLAVLFAGKGIGAGTRVVVYDNGRETPAARLFWTLDYLGHRAAAVLDGGFAAWQAAGNQVAVEPASVQPAQFVPAVESSALHTKAECERMLASSSGVVMLDARSPEEYRGDDVRAKYGGRIPGAVNVDWREHFGADGLLKAPEALRALYTSKGVTPDKEIVAYCKTGQRSSVTYWVLRLLGYPRVANYAGSWVEWGNDPNTPKQAG